MVDGRRPIVADATMFVVPQGKLPPGWLEYAGATVQYGMVDPPR
jgi:hypothetical protein